MRRGQGGIETSTIFFGVDTSNAAGDARILHETQAESCEGVVNEPHRSLESVSASTAAGRSARKAVNRPTEAREGVPVTDRNFSDRPDQSDQPRPRKVP